MIKDNRSSPFLPAVPLHRPMMAETMQKSLKSTSGLPQGYLRVKSGFRNYQNGMLHCGVVL